MNGEVYKYTYKYTYMYAYFLYSCTSITDVCILLPALPCSHIYTHAIYIPLFDLLIVFQLGTAYELWAYGLLECMA
jgi:hypothetical protein